MTLLKLTPQPSYDGSRKTIDPQRLIALAPEQLRRGEGYTRSAAGSFRTRAGFPSYEEIGTVVNDGQSRLLASKTVAVSFGDDVFLLQLYVQGLPDERDIVSAAADVVFTQTTIMG